MRNGLKLASAAVVTAGAVAGSVATGLPSAQAATTPAARTCAAYRTWVAHPSTGRLNTMLTDSETAPWKYVGEDAVGLYKDVRRGAAASYITKDKAYFAKDC